MGDQVAVVTECDGDGGHDVDVQEAEGPFGPGDERGGRVKVGCVEVGYVVGWLDEGEGGGCLLREQERETQIKELREHRGVLEWTGPSLKQAMLCARF